MAEISVVVPVYGVEPYLNRCVDSILAQSFSDFKLILVDDGSPDGCPEICDEYAFSDKRVHVIHQDNGGTACARNAGIEWVLKQGESRWITFIDSDDWVHTDYLKILLTGVSGVGADCSVVGYVEKYNDVYCVTDSLTNSGFTEITPNEFFGRLYVYKNVKIPVNVPWGKLFNIECFKNVRFPIGKKFEDRFTMHKVIFQCTSLALSPRPLYYYYLRENSATRISWQPGELDDIDAIREQISFFKIHNALLAYNVAIKDYYRVTMRQLTRIRTIGNAEYRKYENRVRRELLCCLIKYSNSLNLSPEETRDAYFAVFPVLKRIAKIVKRVLHKLMR